MNKKYRVKCPNPGCNFSGMVDGKSDRPFVKTAIGIPPKRQHLGTRLERIQFRCPKCGTRWRERADRVR
jgi:hypothetical protein